MSPFTPRTSALLAVCLPTACALVLPPGRSPRCVSSSLVHFGSKVRLRAVGMSSVAGRGETSPPKPGGMPWGVVYGLGFGAITASRIAHEAHLQAFYLNSVRLAPELVGAGWILFCVAVAVAEPTIGLILDRLRAKGIRQATVLRSALLPWLLFVYLIWAPAYSAHPLLLLLPILGFGLTQAMHLSLRARITHPFLLTSPPQLLACGPNLTDQACVRVCACV